MSKRIWINISLLFLVISLSANIFFLENETEQKILPLTSIRAESINKIEIHRDNSDDIIFIRKDDVWFMEAPLQLKANVARIESILKILKTQSYNKFNISDVDAAEFELKNPTVILKLNENKIYFGTSNPVTQKRYVSFDNMIHITDDFLYPQLKLNASFFTKK